VCPDSTRALIRAAEQSGVTRVVIMSAFGVGDSLPKGSMMGRFFYKRVIPASWPTRPAARHS
jgi:hypothetical protein